jgi:hypothetical protein
MLGAEGLLADSKHLLGERNGLDVLSGSIELDDLCVECVGVLDRLRRRRRREWQEPYQDN